MFLYWVFTNFLIFYISYRTSEDQSVQRLYSYIPDVNEKSFSQYNFHDFLWNVPEIQKSNLHHSIYLSKSARGLIQV